MKGHRGRSPESYTHRTYRALARADGLSSCNIRVRDTDLQVQADREVAVLAEELTLRYRLQIERHIQLFPEFATALTPLPEEPLAPAIVRAMLAAGQAAGVGPMAAVAGAIAEFVGRDLLRQGCKEVVVENGGDIFLHRLVDCTVAVFAGESPLSLRFGLRLTAAAMPLAVCTSSGTVGHSLSFGEADSVTVLAKSTPLADAVATRLGNVVGQADGKYGISRALEAGMAIAGVAGVVVVCGASMGAVGDVELVGLA